MLPNGPGGIVTPRVDRASRLVHASPADVYEAFARPGAMEQWLPPDTMTGTMVRFDFRAGGGYRMRLTYDARQDGRGKTSHDSDEVEVRFVHLEPQRRIVQEVDFESDDPSFAGTMRLTWTFVASAGGTRVTVRAENVPEGIRPEDHQAGLGSTLANLAAFTETGVMPGAKDETGGST